MTDTDTKTEDPQEAAEKVGQPCRCFSIVDEVTDDDGATFEVRHTCGELVYGKREFKPGHDAKLKSGLIKAFRDGVDFTYQDGGMLVHADPVEMAKDRGWEKFLTPAKPRKSRAKAKDKAEKVETNGAERADDDAPASVEGFQPASFKIGRWTKDGVVVSHNDDGTITVSYLDKKSKRQTATLDADKVELG